MKGCPYLHVAGRELIKGAHGTSLLEPHVPGPRCFDADSWRDGNSENISCWELYLDIYVNNAVWACRSSIAKSSAPVQGVLALVKCLQPTLYN